MAQKSGFFNALNVNGTYDRKYNADDYCDNLAVIISNGVLRSENDDLKVTSSGMVCTVSAGRAWINGHWYVNDAPYVFAGVTAPVGGSRWDRVILRFDNTTSTRNIYLLYVQGTASSTPVKPAPVRTSTIYDLVLADVFVNTNATSVVVTDKRADSTVCGWVYSTSGDASFFTTLDNDFNAWFTNIRTSLATTTIFARYVWKTTLAAATNKVTFDIPQYDGTGVSYLEIYVNGNKRDTPNHYSVSGSTITFTNNLTAGTLVTVQCFKSIDGTGINSIVDNVTELENRVAGIEYISHYNYECTGINDNISLSQIAQAFYTGSYVAADVTAAAARFLSDIGGNTYLASLPEDAQLTVNVIGNIGVSTPYSGDGTSTSRYKWFALGVDALNNKRLIFDFANCSRVYVAPAGVTNNIIFYGTDLNIRNATVVAKCNAADCNMEMFAGRYPYGGINVDNCSLRISTTGTAYISKNGNFINCTCYVSSANDHALMFVPDTNSIVQLIGGTYRAYTASQLKTSAIMYTYGTAPNAVVMATNINCPTIAVSAFYQNYMCVAYAGKTYINGVCTTLPSDGNYKEISGHCNFNKR